MEFDLKGIFSSFLVVLGSETGDRTFMILVVLATKYPALVVVLGNQIAMVPLIFIAAFVGSLVTLLPKLYVNIVTFLLFSIFSFLAYRESLHEFQKMKNKKAKALEEQPDADAASDSSSDSVNSHTVPLLGNITWFRALLSTISLVFVGEWGDISQLAMMPLASTFPMASVVTGAFFGFLVCAIAATLIGKIVEKYVNEIITGAITGTIFLGFAGFTLYLIIEELVEG